MWRIPQLFANQFLLDSGVQVVVPFPYRYKANTILHSDACLNTSWLQEFSVILFSSIGCSISDIHYLESLCKKCCSYICVLIGPRTMGLLGMMGDSFGCSATGERLVSAARDGDIQEARALLELNPRLARYSTFGIRNSPLHYSAAKGHHEVNHWFYL